MTRLFFEKSGPDGPPAQYQPGKEGSSGGSFSPTVPPKNSGGEGSEGGEGGEGVKALSVMKQRQKVMERYKSLAAAGKWDEARKVLEEGKKLFEQATKDGGLDAEQMQVLYHTD